MRGGEAKACVSRQFRAPAEKLFDAWLIPDLIGQWMFGPNLRDEEIVRLTVDARTGGAFSFVVRREGEELNHIGRYLEITRPHRLVFTWGVEQDGGDHSRVQVDIASQGQMSALSLFHELDPRWAGSASTVGDSWQKMLSVLAKIIELPISEETQTPPTPPSES